MSKFAALVLFTITTLILTTSAYILLYNPIYAQNFSEINQIFLFLSFFAIIFVIITIYILIFIERIVFRVKSNLKGDMIFVALLVLILVIVFSSAYTFIFYPINLSAEEFPSNFFLTYYLVLEIVGYGILTQSIRKYNLKQLRFKLSLGSIVLAGFLALLSVIDINITKTISLTTVSSAKPLFYLGYFFASFIIIFWCCIVGYWLSMNYWLHKRSPKQEYDILEMETHDKKICVYIPAYNAAYTLPQLFDRIQPQVRDKIQQIVVIDDHSPDNTYLLALGLKKEQTLSKMSIYRTKENQKYGGNQKLGYSLSLIENYDIVVMLHGDAQYAPELIPKIIEPLVKGEADMVFGSRMLQDPLKGGMPPTKYIGNKSLTFIENLVLGTKLTEFHSGYRAYSCEALAKIPFLRCTNEFHFDTEIIIQFVLANLRIVEVSIPTYYGDEVSRVNKLSYGLNILKEILAYYFVKIGITKNEKFNIQTHTFSMEQIQRYVSQYMERID